MHLPDAVLADQMLNYAPRVAACATMEALRELAIATAAGIGMTAIASGMVSGPRADTHNPFHFSNWPDNWIAHYLANGYLEKDPLPRWAIVSGATALWSEVVSRLPAGDPGHEMLADARRFGFAEGVIVPVRTMDGQLGLVSIGGPRTTLNSREVHFLQAIGTSTLHRAEALMDAGAPRGAPSLSRRERECVALLVQGQTEREIAHRLGIREVTVRFHLDNAREKTGTRSRTHLAGVAAQWMGRL